MSENSKIEWTDHTFNPWEGCQKVSPGCDRCYAEARNARYGGGTAVNWGPGAPRRRTSPANWRKPLQWNREAGVFYAEHRRRQRVFCASLADVFDKAAQVEWRSDLFDLIRATPDLDWLLLTKRIGNVRKMLEEVYRYRIEDDFDAQAVEWIQAWLEGSHPQNVWIGATIVNQEEANRDIPKLLGTPARVRFLSIEPMLGPISLRWLSAWPENAPRAAQSPSGKTNHLDGLRRLDWVIVGGESGPGARPMHPTWPRLLRDQCTAARVPFLFKQWGEWTDEDWGERAGLRDTAGVLPSGEFLLMSEGYSPPFDDGERLSAAGNVRLDGRMLMDRVGKKATGRLLDGRTHNDFPKATS